MASQWLPLDDILLKTSIEDGASLESLAKGAVQFSRRFTIEELHDRWHSILYDPVVSAQVCARMALSESVDISDEFNRNTNKRKAECIRNCYYAKRRACSHQFPSGDMGILMDNSFMYETFSERLPKESLESSRGIEGGNVDGLYDVGTSALGNDIFGPSDTLEDPMYQNTSMNFLDDFWIGETSRSEALPDHNLFEANTIDSGTSYENLRNSQSMPEMSNWKTVEDLLSEMPDDDGSARNNMHFKDQVRYNNGGEGTSHNPSFNDQENATDWTNDDKNDDVDDTSSLDGFHDHLLNTLEYVNDEEMCREDGINQGPEYCNGVIFCALNTEDPEVPCNNFNFPSKRSRSGNKRSRNKARMPSPWGKVTRRMLPLDKCRNTLNLEPKVVTRGLPIHRSGVQFGDIRQKSAGVEKLRHTETKEVKMSARNRKQDAHQIVSAPRPPSIIETEAVSCEHQHYSDDIDGDIPSVADVESMILNMDLLPEDQDAHCSVEVVKYQEEDVMREIIRLEQSAHSCMQRDMASHGAFAALFGRYSKHYIKKAEVLLGRKTKGVNVDIDLTSEGRSNKISRRQASIKMDVDGSFSLTNFGNKKIYVNNEEILPGHRLDLPHDCLIEIMGMIFTFTVNQQRVQMYLDNAD